jgi:hypothetical protein
MIGAAVVLAWLGMYIHNRADLPGLTLWSPENAGPAAVWIVCFAIWWRFARAPWAAMPLAAWGALNLVGGFLSVLPLPFLPFAPEQSLRHYGFHLLYAAAQVPLLALARAELRRHSHRTTAR